MHAGYTNLFEWYVRENMWQEDNRDNGVRIFMKKKDLP